MDAEIDILATRVLEKARTKGWLIATAESCTGGLVAAALTKIPGSSDVFERGFITYSNDAKMDMLDVKAEKLAEHGAVSELVAGEMAVGACLHSRANLTVSITGIAGPGGTTNKAEGMVCFGLHFKGTTPSVSTQQYGALGREVVRRHACLQALSLLEQRLDA